MKKSHIWILAYSFKHFARAMEPVGSDYEGYPETPSPLHLESDPDDIFVLSALLFAKLVLSNQNISAEDTNTKSLDFENEDSDYVDKYEDTEYRMDTFVEILKTFVTGSVFKVGEFELTRDKLVGELADISKQVAQLSPTRRISDQLSFLKRMFKTMTESALSLKHFSSINSPGSRLLYKMIELNIRAYVLHDTHGGLDYASSTEKVLILTDTLYCWGEMFEDLENILFEMRLEFRIYFNQAENTLLYLRSYIPKWYLV